MTVKEIAQATGRAERSVRRWIEKVLNENFSLRNTATNDIMSLVNSIKTKADKSSPENPADYDLEETLLIIEAGMGKNAAGVFRANAASKNAVSVNLAKSAGLPANFEERLSSLIGDIVEKKMAAMYPPQTAKDLYSQKDLARLSKARKLINIICEDVVDWPSNLCEPQDSSSNRLIEVYNLLSHILNKRGEA